VKQSYRYFLTIDAIRSLSHRGDGKGFRDENINNLTKRGYLGRDELDDPQAISQAVSLFIWDALYGAPRQIASKGAKRLGSGKSSRSRKSMSISRGAATT
jgi:hypothetical protein